MGLPANAKEPVLSQVAGNGCQVGIGQVSRSVRLQNKYLADQNKSWTGAKATKKRRLEDLCVRIVRDR